MGQKYIVLKPIVYKNPKSKLYRQVIQPGDFQLVEFPHLSDNDIKLLVKVRVIAKASKNDEKTLLEAKQAILDNQQELENQAAQKLADAKANAMAKMIEKMENE